MERPITVLVADDHVGLATALTSSLAQRYAVESAVNSPSQLRNALRDWRSREGWKDGPLVVLLDISFGPDAPSGLDMLEELMVECPEARYVMHSMYATKLFVSLALEKGALGFVDKLSGLGELWGAIEAAASGRTAVFAAAEAWGGGVASPRIRPSRPLTPVLRRVLALLQAGRKRREIAEILGLTLSAVEADITRLRRLYGLHAEEKIDWRECGPS